VTHLDLPADAVDRALAILARVVGEAG